MSQILTSDHYIWSSDGDSDNQLIKIHVRCFGAYFEIQYLRHNLAASPYLLAQHEKSLCIMRAGDEGNSSDVENGIKEICRLQKPFEALMTELAPNPPPPATHLFDYLYPPHMILEATAATQDSTVIQPRFRGSLPRQVLWPPGQYLATWGDWLESVKCFTSRQVRLVHTSTDPEQHPCLRGPSKVTAGDGVGWDAVCYFKALVRRVPGELWAYKQIAAALEAKKLRPEMRISRLHGVVVDEDRDVLQHYDHVPKEELAKWDDFGSESKSEDESPARMVGILITYIENKGTLYEVAPWSDCLDEHRRSWADELLGLVVELHKAGLVWGDAKPHNVLVDRQDRLWLIDFDGGYTHGWVDEVKKETKEGDLQGVERIKEWLAKYYEKPLDRSVPRSS
ncbi:hypothetical protein HYALB_00000980 [Hymenoscyphus albidus]|uniref:Protein kinase domain-containing protein n=1 Tax=Hymenoscyphus albidus TaxID=595503 RepID=A0A9N9LX31_9HELO|nr:hypothetical protein HYALB_00000980 [Hymenoscyphus albidus]